VEFRIEQRFDASAADVEQALLDPAFIEASAVLPKLGRSELLSQTAAGPVVHTRIRYAFTGELSGAVRRVVNPDRLTWIHDATTDTATHHTTFEIVPDHYRELLRATGTVDVTPAGDGCLRRAAGTVSVSVPLVGARVERAVVSGLEEHAAAERDLLARWLADRAT